MKKEKINRVYIFDMDGTLLDTPLVEEGKIQFEKITGKKYPHLGWWGRAESLMSEFDIQPFERILPHYQRAVADPEGLTVMLTNRQIYLKDLIMPILQKHSLDFDQYSFKRNHRSKLDRAMEIIAPYPDVNEIEVWEDMSQHVQDFGRIFSIAPNIKAKIHYVNHKEESWKTIENLEQLNQIIT